MADIRDLMNSAQEVIDSATENTVENHKTYSKAEQVLETVRNYTDNALNIHNTNTTSHPDIRAQLTSLFNDPVISGTSTVESGEANTWIFSVTSKLGGIQASNFVVTLSDGTAIDVPIPEGNVNTASWTHTFTGDRNSTTYFTVTAQGGSFSSKPTMRELLITKQVAPDMTNMTCSLPSTISHGQRYTFRINNIVDLDDDLETVTVVSDNNHITFSSNTLQLATDYELIVDNTGYGPDEVIITFTATDSGGRYSTKSYSLHLNADPVASGMTHTYPNYLSPGVSYLCRVGGITDVDNSASEITYSVSSSIPEVTFSKSTGIALNEDITVSVDSTAVAGTAYTLTFTFTDIYGGSCTSTITSTINEVPDVSEVVCSLPSHLVPGSSGTFTVSGATDSEEEDLVYSLENISQYLTISKTSNITSGETLNYSISASAPRGEIVSLTVRVTDASSGSATAIFNRTINQIVSTLSTTLQTVYAPAATRTFTINTATDADNQNLTFTVTSAVPSVVITNGANAVAGDVITIVTPSESDVVRGETWDLIITVNDGFEDTVITKTITQAYLPVVDCALDTIDFGENGFFGGDEIIQNPTDTTTYGEFFFQSSLIADTTDQNGLAVNYRIYDASATPIVKAFYNDEGTAVDISRNSVNGAGNGETFRLVGSHVANDTTVTLTVVAVNSEGEYGATACLTFTVDLWHRLMIDTPAITYPANNDVAEYYQGFTATFTNFSYSTRDTFDVND